MKNFSKVFAMVLTSLNQGDVAYIKRIDDNSEIKKRLLSMGLIRGSKIAIEGFAPGKKTIKIAVDDSSCFALRYNEAKKIVVEKI